MTSETHSVLSVTKDPKLSTLVSTFLIQPLFDLTIVKDFNEARRLCSERTFNIILVDFCDGEGIDFAIDMTDSLSTIMILSPAQHFDQISYKVEPFGILTMTDTFDQFYFYNMIKIAIAVHYKVQILSTKATKLKEKMEEIRIINRAKLLLMQNLSLTEPESHRYLEKQAMDRGLKRMTLAEEIIRTYS